MRRLTLPLALLAALALAASAAAATNAALFDLGFATKKTAKSTSFSFDVAFANAGGDPVPAALTRFTVSLPKGSKFNHAGAPQCTATDKQLTAKGSAACAAKTQVGTGKASAVPAGGGNTINTTVKIFNMDKKQFMFQIQLAGKDAARFFATTKRTSLASQALTGKLPGGVIVTSLEGSIKKKSSDGKNLITSPAKCPKSKKWTFGGTFKFADGTHKVTDTASCKS